MEEAVRQAPVIPIPGYIRLCLYKINEAQKDLLQEGVPNPTLSQIAERSGLNPDDIKKAMNRRVTVVQIDKEAKTTRGFNLQETIPDSTQRDPTEYIEQQEICEHVGCEDLETLQYFWKGELKFLDVFKRRMFMKSIVTGTYNTMIPEDVLFLYFRSDPFYKRNLWRRMSFL